MQRQAAQGGDRRIEGGRADVVRVHYDVADFTVGQAWQVAVVEQAAGGGLPVGFDFGEAPPVQNAVRGAQPQLLQRRRAVDLDGESSVGQCREADKDAELRVLLAMFQVYNSLRVTYLPLYTPIADELANKSLFASGVRSKMASGASAGL